MILQSKASTAYVPHPEGVHAAVCVDVIDLGMMEVTYQGRTSMKPMVRLVFETEELLEDGRNATIHKRFTASVHPKSRLAEFLGKWRGKPVADGESIDLAKLIGASCTLIISHEERDGRTYASIDMVSKPTKKLKPSGHYDPAAARERIAHWAAKDAAAAGAAPAPVPQAPVVTAPASPAKVAAAIPPKPKASPVQEVAEDDVPF